MSISPGNSRSIAQESGEKWTGQADLQPISFKSDRLLAAQYRTAIIVVTHDDAIIPTFRRIYHIRDGRTHEEAGEGRAIVAAEA